MWDYTEKVMEHFLAPKNAGEIESPDAVGEVGSIACGDALKLTLKLDENERILDAKFKTFGCASAIASSSVLTELIKGKTLDEAAQVTNREIAEALGGLPEEKMHCSVMGQEALEAAIKSYREKGHPDAAPNAQLHTEGRIVCKCFGVTDATIKNAIRENNLHTVEDVIHFTKAGGSCGQCQGEIAEILREVLGESAIKIGAPGTEVQKPKKPLSNLQRMQLIEQVVDEVIRPHLVADGGDIELVDIDRTEVTITLHGACGSCPISDFTLKDFVERVLREKVDPQITVVEQKDEQ